MNGLRFEDESQVVVAAPNRADIALFVGFVGHRGTPLPAEVERWLDEQGWAAPPHDTRPGEMEQDVRKLLNVPVPIDTWDVFDHLFRWEYRGVDEAGRIVATYLGAGVRSFFAQGGRKCYVVRVGDAWPLTSTRQQRLSRIEKLIPGYPNVFEASPLERRSWLGMAHLFGLPEVSFLCLPDLSDAVGDRIFVTAAEPPRRPKEQFVECSDPGPVPPPDALPPLYSAPRCDREGYEAWASALRLAAEVIRLQVREVQLVAAVPLPQPRTEADGDLLGFLLDNTGRPPGASPESLLQGIASPFVQLAYPWIRTPGSIQLPEGAESPDAVLAGVLARNALTRGTYHSAANLHLAEVYDTTPLLDTDQLMKPRPAQTTRGNKNYSLLERISFFGQTPAGPRLLSDVTTSLDESYRPASVNRLVAAIVRAARRLGEELIFESSGERLWAGLKERIEDLLLGLLQAGALRGANPAEAFQVRCDRRTMTQADLDNGRAIVLVQFEAALPIERITVVLAMNEGGQISLLSGGKEAA